MDNLILKPAFIGLEEWEDLEGREMRLVYNC